MSHAFFRTREHLTAFLGLAIAALCAASCSSQKTAAPATTDAGASPQFAKSDCGTCVLDACATDVQTCTSDSSCASWLSCVESCPIDATGNADATCETACPAATGPGATAQTAVNACRTSGSGAACAACGTTPMDAGSKPIDPLLDEMCPKTKSADDCSTCKQNACCNAEHTCYKDTDCQQYIGCLGDCASASDPAMCTSACVTTHARGADEYARMYTCEMLSCDGVAACKASSCDVCGAEKCADELLACDKDGKCYAFGFCFQHCKGDMTCIGKCQTAFPTAVKPFDTLLSCLSNKCTTSC